MKTVWIINQYASTPEYGHAGRHYYLGKELVKLGYKVYLIASATHHLLREEVTMDSTIKIENHDGLKVVWVDMVKYTNAHSKQRVVNWFTFCWKLYNLSNNIPDKPDSILCSSPSLLSFLAAHRLSKKFEAKLCFEVRDIWPLTLTEIGGYSVNHPFIKILQWTENKAYRESDVVVSNLKNAYEHMIAHGMESSKFVWIPNGFSKNEIDSPEPLASDVYSKIPKNKFIVGYTGTFGLANDLYTLLAAAKKLKNNSEIEFVLVGGGKDKNELIDYVQKHDLDNVTILDFIKKKQIQSMLSHFHVLTVGAKKQPMYRFGVSPNKLYDYLVSGKPIIYHINSGNYHPISESGCGFEVEPGDPDMLAECILKLYRMPHDERELMGADGRRAAFEQYEYGQLAEKLSEVLFKK